ncbi:MAG: tetraacyldisaccharide 4'-kinase [Phycisphaeraceae bacterium]|nr:tetraacyldisaccharide 4'-kinase [Phycisphaeraceae bacterium]
MTHGASARPWLAPLGWAYGAAVEVARRWRQSIGGVTRLDIPVVSVGNLTVGGTGKGPVVRWVVERLMARGAHPAIALRGYRAGPQGSDEALEHAELLPGVPLSVGADRIRAIGEVRSAHREIDCVVLDDGFQHWRLARDLDLVLIDATRPGLDEAMLPAGSRREWRSALRRADGVIVTRAERVDEELALRILKRHGREPLAWCHHAWSVVRVFDRGVESREGSEWFAGRRVGLVAGIGNPEAFMGQVTSAGAKAQWLLRGRDHAAFDEASVKVILRAADEAKVDAIVTTLKDWVKLGPLLLRRAGEAGAGLRPLAVPIAEVKFISGESTVIDRIHAVLRGRGSAGRGE